MKLLGLYREAEYSPGRHRSNDVLLLEQVGDALRDRGFAVDLSTLDAAVNRSSAPRFVFSMCQGRRALERLRQWERIGVCVINHPTASLNTYRERLPGLMQDAGICFPPTRFVATVAAAAARIEVNGGIWLKRGDVHASVSADVQWIESNERLKSALTEFRSRGIARAALQEHQAGDEIKFYAIAGGRFFEAFHPLSAVLPHFDRASLRQLAEAAGAAAGLEIFGGDAILGPDGQLTLIDLNDWPSFAPCRERASEAIADYVMRRVNDGWSPGLVSSANESAV